MIFSENRYTLFRIMLQIAKEAGPHAVPLPYSTMRSPLNRARTQ